MLAAELAAKSYPAVFYVSEGTAAELIARCAPFLGGEDAAAALSELEKLDLKIEYNCALNAGFIASEAVKYDVSCVSREVYAALGGGGSDAVTLYDESLGVIARPDETGGVLGAFYDARRAGVSADRLVQGMSPASSRGDEGAAESSLYTDLSGVRPSVRVPENGVYSAGDAQSEAARCIQCACDECMKSCAWLRHYGKSPRVMTREIYNNVGIIMGDHMWNGAINSCALCSQCTVVCPNGYDMAEICLSARRNMVATGKMSLAVHEFALYDQLFSNGEAFLARPQPGFEKCEYVFFPGCQAAACALIYVGVLMMSNVKHIDFEQVRNAVPAFFTIIIMPLGYSITDGIGMGLLLYVVISLIEYVVAAAVAGAKKLPMPKFDIPIVTFIVAIMFAAYFFIPTSF